MTTTVNLGILQPGDTVSYDYQLTAQGTTLGGEQGYMAFLGDPFGLDVTSGNLVLSTTSVPEPASWMLGMIGLVCIVVVRGGRRPAQIIDWSRPHAVRGDTVALHRLIRPARPVPSATPPPAPAGPRRRTAARSARGRRSRVAPSSGWFRDRPRPVPPLSSS